MTHAFANTPEDLQDRSGKSGQLLFAARAARSSTPTSTRLPVSMRIVLESVLRNCDGKKVTPEHVRRGRQLEAEAPSAPTRSRSSSPASCCRTSPACRCSPTWRRCATWPHEMGKDPKTIEPLVPVDLVVDHSVMIDYYGTQGRARPEHEAGVPAQPRALPVHEVGHAGVRHLRRRAARASASCTRSTSSTWRAACTRPAQDERRVLPRLAGRHRQPHDDDQRHRRGRLGRRRHRGRGRRCSASRSTS